MSEKKKPKTWHAEGTHPTNTSRARVAESPTAPVGGSYAAASAARSAGAGNGSTSSFNPPKQGKFIPHDVRAAGFRRDGFTPKEAKRLASYQSSTAGLARADAGEMPDPRNPTGSTFKQPAGTSTTPTPTTNTEIVAGAQTAVDPRGATHTSRTKAGSPQSNFRAAQSAGTMTPEKVAQAHEYAKSTGTTFDEKTGYDRKPFLDKKNKAASVDPEPEAELTESNQPEGGGTASFRMPDGSMRTIGANEDVHDKFKSIRAEDGHLARQGESTSNRAEEPAQSAIEQGDGSVAPPPPVERAALPSPEKNARDVQSVATLEEPASTKPASVPALKVPTAKDVKAKPLLPVSVPFNQPNAAPNSYLNAAAQSAKDAKRATRAAELKQAKSQKDSKSKAKSEAKNTATRTRDAERFNYTFNKFKEDGRNNEGIHKLNAKKAAKYGLTYNRETGYSQ